MEQTPQNYPPHQNYPQHSGQGFAGQPPYPQHPQPGFPSQPPFPPPHGAPHAYGSGAHGGHPQYPPKKRGMPLWAVLLIVAGVAFFVLPVGCIMLVAVASSGKSRESRSSGEAEVQAPVRAKNQNGGDKPEYIKLTDVTERRLEISEDKFLGAMGISVKPTKQVSDEGFKAWYFSDGRWVETFTDPEDGSLITLSVAGLLEGSAEKTKAFIQRAVSAVLGRPIERDVIERWLNTFVELTAGGKSWKRCSGEEVIEGINFSWSVDEIISDVGVTKPTARELVVGIQRGD